MKRQIYNGKMSKYKRDTLISLRLTKAELKALDTISIPVVLDTTVNGDNVVLTSKVSRANKLMFFLRDYKKYSLFQEATKS